jgi:uncharacterized repeat protein (TIGR01451 family)
MKHKIWHVLVVIALLMGSLAVTQDAPVQAQGGPTWTRLSSSTGDLPVPGGSDEQTASLVLDIDRSGVQDFVIAARVGSPSVVWYRHSAAGWTRYVIDNTPNHPVEAGGAYFDIDGDGDLDILFGADSTSGEMWWYENPYPTYDVATPWNRYTVKSGGGNGHHDQMFADVDGDGQAEFVTWNQGPDVLLVAEIPANPRTSGPWTFNTIFTGTGVLEGMDFADIDLDGLPDIIAGGRWFKYAGGTTFNAHVIDTADPGARIVAGDFNAGGRPEIVVVPGDYDGPLMYYECPAAGDPTLVSCWVGRDLYPGVTIDNGHSLRVGDVNLDGNLDLFVAEMRLNSGNPDAGMWLFLGNGAGGFVRDSITVGVGNHESRLADLDGDGDLDILQKPYNWSVPRVDVWLNQSSGGARLVCPPPLDSWTRYVIDDTRPWQSVFITAEDVNGDGLSDIITGGWWYANPGSTGGTWVRNDISAPLNNMAVVYDFDGDGDPDILGTEGQVNSNVLLWAQNDGAGNFTIFNNIQAAPAFAAGADFLQGVQVGTFSGGPLEVMLSWHASGQGVQRLTVPADPTVGTWAWDQPSPASQDEDLSAGQIDGAGGIDLLLGTQWLQNAGGGAWNLQTLFTPTGDPDRNELADINGDGLLDAIVGYEAISVPGTLAWYQQGAVVTDPWTENVISSTIVGPMSLDVFDMDGDGDADVIAGEHNLASPASARALIFENDGTGTAWTEHVVYTGDEHHDGMQAVDIDNDGDRDLISISWGDSRVVLYENVSNCTLVNEAPALDIFDPGFSKLGTPGEALPGEEVRWWIELRNNGTLPLNGVRVRDRIDDRVYTVLGADTSKGNVVIGDVYVDFEIGRLEPGELVTMIVVTRVRDDVIGPLFSINVATLTAGQVTRTAEAHVNILGGPTRLPATGYPPAATAPHMWGSHR